MSAMHWEARRRQSALDRRKQQQQQQQQLVQKSAESRSNATETDTPQEQPGRAARGRCPHCDADPKAPSLDGGKIPNRYSSLQYSQQW